jgi:Cys-tRNA(Pro) deacylase
MIETNYPMTQAIRTLKDAGIPFLIHSYQYVEHGGTPVAARELGADEHAVIKTLVFETDAREPLLVLMYGDKEVSVKALARILGVKTVSPASPDTAARHTGYQIGGISPFGTRKRLKVQMQSSILGLPKIYINAGKRGLLAEIAPVGLQKVLQPTLVDIAI